jgi:hypothetical protein
MSKLLRAAYRLLFLNRIIRWTWLTGLVLFAVKIGTDRGFAWHRTPASKTIFTLNPSDIESFMIQNQAEEDLYFSRQDTNWLVVKNNVTLRLPEDSVRPYLILFSNMERLAVKTLPNVENADLSSETPQVGGVESPKWQVSIFAKKGIKHVFSIHYIAFDSLSNQNLTFLKRADERLLNGVKGDWSAILNRNFDDFRDRRFFDFSLATATDMSFQNPTDTLNILRQEAVWRCRNVEIIEPVVLKNFVENLDLLRGLSFYDADRDLLADRKIASRLIVKTPTDTAILTSFRLDNFYVVHSSRNPENYFKMDSTTHIFLR